MKIITIIGTRPQFVKASVVSKKLSIQPKIEEIIIHTGQHFDKNMSDFFFNQLNIPQPSYFLNINGGSHGIMTGRMLIEIEKILLNETPDLVLIYGDTNSTLAAALAASKLHIQICHVESGLRSFNMRMPEEINRILTDRVSRILFCPTDQSVVNLRREGFSKPWSNIFKVGDVMQDCVLAFKSKSRRPTSFPGFSSFTLATFHRAENTDDQNRLRGIVAALNIIHAEHDPVVVPLHPRTKHVLEKAGLRLDAHIIDPTGYLEMLWLLDHCRMVMTDSGGLQKEAFFFAKPCLTLRDQTEWVELVDRGASILTGAGTEQIVSGLRQIEDRDITDPDELYGGGSASARIVDILTRYI